MKNLKNTSFLALFLLLGTGLFAQSPLDGDAECSFVVINDIVGFRISTPQEEETTFAIYQQAAMEKEERLRKEQAKAERLKALRERPKQ